MIMKVGPHILLFFWEAPLFPFKHFILCFERGSNPTAHITKHTLFLFSSAKTGKSCFISYIFVLFMLHISLVSEEGKEKMNDFCYLPMGLKLETCRGRSRSCWRFLIFLSSSFTLLLLTSLPTVTSSVTYDGRAIIVNGQRRILISGSIHYPRSTPEVSKV